MFLLSLLLLASLHAVACFNVFAGIPAFDGIHTVLALLLLLVSLLLHGSRLWQAFLLFLTSFKFLMVSCCWSLCYCWLSWCKNSVAGVSVVPFKHAVAGGPAVTGFLAVDSVLAVASVLADPGVPILVVDFTFWIVEWDILHYQTIGQWLSDCNFFLLSNNGNIEYRIGVKKLWAIGYRIKASIYRTIGYRTQKKTIGCPPLLVCNVNILYWNLKSQNSQDYAQKPQRNCMFMNLASDDIGKLYCVLTCLLGGGGAV